MIDVTIPKDDTSDDGLEWEQMWNGMVRWLRSSRPCIEEGAAYQKDSLPHSGWVYSSPCHIPSTSAGLEKPVGGDSYLRRREL